MPRYERRRPLIGARLLLGVVSIAAGVAMSIATATTPHERQLEGYRFTSAGLELGDDAAGAAMFDVHDLAPGDASANCIAVTYQGDDLADLRLHGSAAGSGLANSIGLTVEAGTGASFDDCSAFQGSPIYMGTLADFSSVHHDYLSGVHVGHIVAGQPTAFRFTASVLDDNAAQGKDATAAFVWEVQPAAASAPAASTSTTSPATTVPPSTTTTAPSTTTTTAESTSTTTPTLATPGSPRDDEPPPATRAVPSGASDTNRPAPIAAPTDGGTSTGSSVDAGASDAPAVTWSELPPRGDVDQPSGRTQRPTQSDRPSNALAGAVARVSDLVRTTLDVAAKAATEAGKHGAFPGALLIVMGLFLLIQDRLDRKDPKLALAPLHADPDLPFRSRVEEHEQ